MNKNKIEWFFKIIRIAGVNFPVAASLVQLQAEIDSDAMEERINKLSDPISYLHDDIQELSMLIYAELRKKDVRQLDFDDKNIYVKFSKPFAALESQGYIQCLNAIGSNKHGIYLSDPSYIMYLCALAENSQKMNNLVDKVYYCEINKWLDGNEIKNEIDVPLEVIKAVFEIYESKRYGICSKEIGVARYLSQTH